MGWGRGQGNKSRDSYETNNDGAKFTMGNKIHTQGMIMWNRIPIMALGMERGDWDRGPVLCGTGVTKTDYRGINAPLS